MGVIVPGAIAADLRALGSRPFGRPATLEHGVENSALNRLESVSNVGEGPCDDNAHRVIHIASRHLLGYWDRFYSGIEFGQIWFLLMDGFRGAGFSAVQTAGKGVSKREISPEIVPFWAAQKPAKRPAFRLANTRGADTRLYCAKSAYRRAGVKQLIGSLVAGLTLFGVGVLIGCGGGGAGGSGNGNGDLVAFYVELPGRDALNLIIGDSVKFELAGYDANLNRTVLTAESWSLANVVGSPGNLGPDGTFVATGTGSATVKATYQNKTITPINVVVHPPQAFVSGNVSSIYGGGIANCIVTFYDNGNVEVGRARTNANGAFTASVPTTATKVNFAATGGIPNGWYKEWLYRTKRYSASIANCHAVMVLNVPLSNGATSNFTDGIRLTPISDPPPPPPDGCVAP